MICSYLPQNSPLEFALSTEDELKLKIVSTFYMHDALDRCCGFYFTDMKFVVNLKKVDLSCLGPGKLSINTDDMRALERFLS